MGSPHFSVIFERDFPAHLKKVKTFQELLDNFHGWGGDKAPMRRGKGGQVWALGIEAKKLGIENTSIQIRFMRNNKQQIRYKDVVTGKLTKSDGTFTSKKGGKK